MAAEGSVGSRKCDSTLAWAGSVVPLLFGELYPESYGPVSGGMLAPMPLLVLQPTINSESAKANGKAPAVAQYKKSERRRRPCLQFASITVRQLG